VLLWAVKLTANTRTTVYSIHMLHTDSSDYLLFDTSGLNRFTFQFFLLFSTYLVVGFHAVDDADSCRLSSTR